MRKKIVVASMIRSESQVLLRAVSPELARRATREESPARWYLKGSAERRYIVKWLNADGIKERSSQSRAEQNCGKEITSQICQEIKARGSRPGGVLPRCVGRCNLHERDYTAQRIIYWSRMQDIRYKI